MGSNGILGLDHLVAAVSDLDAARDAYTRLGFTVAARSRYPELRAFGHDILFSGGPALELFAIDEQRPVNAHYAAFLRQRQGLAAVGLRTADAAASSRSLTEAGFTAAAAAELHHFDRSAEDIGEVRFTTAQIDQKATPGGRFFLCQPHSPRPVPEAGHANTATEVLALVVVADLPAAVAERYAQLFGVEVTALGGDLAVETGDVRIVVSTPARLHWAWTDDPVLSVPRPSLAGLVLRVANLDKAQQALQQSKFPTVAGNGALRVGSASSCGVALAFTAEFDLDALIP